MNDIDLKRLQADELHEVEPAETAAPIVYRSDNNLKCGKFSTYIAHPAPGHLWISHHWLGSNTSVLGFESVELDELITLLQEARRLIVERGK